MLTAETISIPYGFYADVVPGGARKLRYAKVACRNPVSVKLRYLAGSEAPIMMVVSEPTWDTNGAKPSLESMIQRTAVRYFEHRYWRLARSTKTADALLTYTEFKTCLLNLGNGTLYTIHSEPPGLAQNTLRRIESSPEETRVCQGIRKFAAKYVVIDGLFYHACNPPQYVISTYGLGNNHGGTSLHISWERSVGPKNRNVFAADELDAALTKANRVASDRGDTNFLPIVLPGEILLVAPLPGRSTPEPADAQPTSLPIRSAHEL